MTKRNILIPVVAGIVALFTSCLDDESSTENHLITFTEVIDGTTGGVQNVQKSEAFYYTDIQLMKHSTRQQIEEQEVVCDVKLYYQENKVYTESTVGNHAEYTLNEEGMAQTCSYTEPASELTRQFTFGYTPEGYLENIREEINGELVSNAQLSYQEGNLTQSVIDGHRTRYQTSNHENRHQLPCLPLTETYPFHFHREAFYAGILGRPTKHLIAHATPGSSSTEWTDYTYEFGEREVLSMIKESTTSKGIVIDENKVEIEVTTVQKRRIQVTIK